MSITDSSRASTPYSGTLNHPAPHVPAQAPDVFALGLDETLMWRRGRFRTKAWSTGIVDVASGQLLDMVRARTAKAPTRWLLRRPHSWLEQIRWAVLDLSGPYRAAFNAALPDAKQVADPFHACGWPTTPSTRSAAGSRTRPWDIAATNTTRCTGPASCSSPRRRTSPTTDTPNCGACSTQATPTARSATPDTAEETLRSIYDIDDANLGAATVNQLAQDLQDPAMPPEINRLGRTIWNWRHQISNWQAARVTNAPTEAANNLVKRVKRAAFGFTNFNNYRIRALLYAGKPNWALLDTLTPP